MEERRITAKQIEAFRLHLVYYEKSPHTVDKYVRDVRHFAQTLSEKPLDKAAVLEYKAMLGEQYARSSANSMLAAVNAFLKFAGWVDLLVRPFKVQRTVYCPEQKELTQKEYLALVNTAARRKNQRLSLLIQTICATGIRISELQFITVEAIRKREATVFCKGKTRTVFLVAKLCTKLLQYAKTKGIRTGSIFITGKGNPLNRSNIWREMKALCAQAGVSPDKVFPHNLRHLFARTFYAMEKDIAKLADILGHESIDTTRIYMISSGAEHRRKLEEMHLIL